MFNSSYWFFLTYKNLNSLGPRYLKDRLCRYLSTCALHSTGGGGGVCFWLFHQAKRYRYGHSEEVVVAPQQWNSFPFKVCLVLLLLSFWKLAKVELFQQPQGWWSGERPSHSMFMGYMLFLYFNGICYMSYLYFNVVLLLYF